MCTATQDSTKWNVALNLERLCTTGYVLTVFRRGSKHYVGTASTYGTYDLGESNVSEINMLVVSS
jgi:hypothetical protein